MQGGVKGRFSVYGGSIVPSLQGTHPICEQHTSRERRVMRGGEDGKRTRESGVHDSSGAPSPDM